MLSRIQQSGFLVALLVGCWLSAVGCRNARPIYLGEGRKLAHYMNQATQIEYPDIETSGMETISGGLEPRTLANHQPTEIWELSLEQAVELALANSQVMTDLGGRVVSSPELVPTVYDPAIAETDPRLGVEGALSQFDAQFATSMFWERNDRVINNILIGGGVRQLQQDVGTFKSSITKRAATGTQFTARHNVNYDWNNQPFNLFPSSFDVVAEVEARHPLLQGGGVEFNRIFGPNATPTIRFRNGVLLARVDQDVSLAEFEAGVRDFVSNVENAYWDLYFAYRQLDARVTARDGALATWRQIHQLSEAGAVGGEAPMEARAGAEYFEFRAQVEDALSGGPGGSTRTGVGSRSGEFTGAVGLYEREANLRLLIGLPQNDGRLIRPADEPTTARISVDWEAMLAEALARRVELRRQRWMVKRRELELTASRNFLLPKLDVVARYRWRGFGDDLIRPNSGSASQFDNAYQTLTDGDFQEWQTGFEFSVPLGLRAGLSAVRNAEHQLARERALLKEQERVIEHDLASAMRELYRAYTVTQTNYNGWLKANERVEAIHRAVNAGLITPEDQLDAQRDRTEAEVRYFRSLVEYNLAIKAMNFEKGALLDYSGVQLSEGPWPRKAYEDAREQARRRSAALHLDYTFTQPRPISRGPVPHGIPVGTESVPEPVAVPGRIEALPLPDASQVRQPVVQPFYDPRVAQSSTRNPVVTATEQHSLAARPVVVTASGDTFDQAPSQVPHAVHRVGFESPLLRGISGQPPLQAIPTTPTQATWGRTLPAPNGAPGMYALPPSAASQ